MLHNPKWNETKPDLSIDGLIAWLEKQPSHASYPAGYPDLCMLAQWAKSMDPKAVHNCRGDNSFCYTVNGAGVDLSYFKGVVFCSEVGDPVDPTFGDALKRARGWKERNHV